MYFVDWDDNDGPMREFSNYPEARAFADSVGGAMYGLDDESNEFVCID